jgi:hypothetical protein
MKLPTFRTIFSAAKNHTITKNGWGDILRADMGDYNIEYWTEEEYGFVKHHEHGLIGGHISLAEMITITNALHAKKKD